MTLRQVGSRLHYSVGGAHTARFTACSPAAGLVSASRARHGSPRSTVQPNPLARSSSVTRHRPPRRHVCQERIASRFVGWPCATAQVAHALGCRTPTPRRREPSQAPPCAANYLTQPLVKPPSSSQKRFYRYRAGKLTRARRRQRQKIASTALHQFGPVRRCQRRPPVYR